MSTKRSLLVAFSYVGYTKLDLIAFDLKFMTWVTRVLLGKCFGVKRVSKRWVLFQSNQRSRRSEGRVLWLLLEFQTTHVMRYLQSYSSTNNLLTTVDELCCLAVNLHKNKLQDPPDERMILCDSQKRNPNLPYEQPQTRQQVQNVFLKCFAVLLTENEYHAGSWIC